MSGENIDYGDKDPLGVILSLAIDDGVEGRGHRKNIFNKAFKTMSCFSGTNTKITVINYNGSDAEMQAFMAKKPDFGEPPENYVGWSESAECSLAEGKMTKVTTRIYNLGEDGTTETKVITEVADM